MHQSISVIKGKTYRRLKVRLCKMCCTPVSVIMAAQEVSYTVTNYLEHIRTTWLKYEHQRNKNWCTPLMASRRKKKSFKSAPFQIYILLPATGERFLLNNVYSEMKVRELKCYAELVAGIPCNLQRLQYLDEGDMLDDSDLKHNDVVSGATIKLKIWRMWEGLVVAVCRGTTDQVFKEKIVEEKDWQSLSSALYRTKVALAEERAGVSLFIAAHRGNSHLIRRLIEEAKADVNMKTSFGRTPLHAAASQGHSNAIDLMLEKGASMEINDVQGKSALNVASQWGFKDSERHLFLFQWQTRAASLKPRRKSKTLMMHQQFDSGFPIWMKGNHAQVYFCQTLPPGEFAGTGISAPRRKPRNQAGELRDTAWSPGAGLPLTDREEGTQYYISKDHGLTPYGEDPNNVDSEEGTPMAQAIQHRPKEQGRSLSSSKSARSISSAKSAVSQKSFQEWLHEKKQSKKQRAKEENVMKQITKEHEKRTKGKSFEDWQRAKQQQKQGSSAQEKRRDLDIIREEPGRYYGLGFVQWLQRNDSKVEEIYNRDIF